MKKVKVEISARHIHISESDLKRLFGKEKLSSRNAISQPGQYAAQQTVDLQGSKRVRKNVRIVGPTRNKTQVELSLTDCWYLGVKPVLKVSGQLASASPITLVGPKGKIKVKAAIVPKRHLHISAAQARAWNLKNGQKISAMVKGERSLIFNEIVVRAGQFATRVHLDTDEGNAANIKAGDWIYLMI